MQNRKLKILITGANGFIGRNITQAWKGKYQLFTPRSRELDLLDTNAVKKYLNEYRFDVILHCAKEDIVYNPSGDNYDVLNKNLRMFYNLEQSNGLYGKLLYLGSGAEYGRNTMPIMVSEDYAVSSLPDDPYGFAKYIMCRAAVHSTNIYNICLLGVFGKYESYQRRFISNNICRSLKGLPMTLRQNALFDYLYIDDLCRILEWFVYNDPIYHHYNVCRGEPVELKSLAELINETTGLGRDLKIANDGFQAPYTADNSRLLNELGNFEFTPYKTAIASLCAYYSSVIDSINSDEL